jgi:hypothetical protein
VGLANNYIRETKRSIGRWSNFESLNKSQKSESAGGDWGPPGDRQPLAMSSKLNWKGGAWTDSSGRLRLFFVTSITATHLALLAICHLRAFN